MPHPVSGQVFQHYRCLCIEVVEASTEDIWRERAAHAKGFLDALNALGYGIEGQAQRIWAEQDKAVAGIPLSFHDPPTVLMDDGMSPEPRAEILVHLTVAQHDYEDDWDWFEGEPGICGAPFCGKTGDDPIHLKPEPHEWEEHPFAPGICRVCGHPKDREWHVTSPGKA